MQFKESSKSESHFLSKDYKRLNQDKQDIIKKLLYVFTFYAGKVSKYTYRQLQQKYFMQLMSDIWIIAGKEKGFDRTGMKWRNVQNIYHSKGRKNVLGFNQFLQILPTVSVYFQSQLQRQESMKVLLYYINAIYESVVIKDLQATSIMLEDCYMTQQTTSFISKLLPDLQKLYKIYFPQQLTNKFRQKDYFYKSFQAFMQIMKEFQVYPKLVSASQLFFIYHQSLNINSQLVYQTGDNIKEMGQYFRFSKFVEAFLPISRLSIFKLRQVNDPEQEQWKLWQKETLKTLFQYMETIKTLKKKRTKFTQTRFTLIVYEEYPQQHHTKKFVVNDKKIQENSSNLGFYDLMARLKL